MTSKELKAAARLRVIELLDNNCNGCQKVVGKKSSEEAEFCYQNCEVGKELRQIGYILDGRKGEAKVDNSTRKAFEKPRELTAESYKQLKEQGATDKDIATMFGISAVTLYNRKKKWGLVDQDHEKPLAPEKQSKSQEELLEELERVKREYQQLSEKYLAQVEMVKQANQARLNAEAKLESYLMNTERTTEVNLIRNVIELLQDGVTKPSSLEQATKLLAVADLIGIPCNMSVKAGEYRILQDVS